MAYKQHVYRWTQDSSFMCNTLFMQMMAPKHHLQIIDNEAATSVVYMLMPECTHCFKWIHLRTHSLCHALVHQHHTAHICVSACLHSACEREIYHSAKLKLLYYTVLGYNIICAMSLKIVKWERGNKAWHALCFTIQTGPERAVRLASLRRCNSCIINLLSNGLLRMNFFWNNLL